MDYEIFEGRVTEIQRIAFVGNEAYSDRRLRRVIRTAQAGILSPFFSNDIFDPDRLELDREALRNFYLNRGYLDFQVNTAVAELARERNAFFVTFSITEGIPYRIGETSVSVFAPGLDAAAFSRLIDLRPGQLYSVDRVDRVV
ncbi:MAG: POTRA domain-containing protein, partial [Pseudomonadota bacterium]